MEFLNIEVESHEGENFQQLIDETENQMKSWMKDKLGQSHVIQGRLTEKMIELEAKLDIELVLIARKGKAPVLSLVCDRSELVISKFLFVHNFDENVNKSLKSKVLGSAIESIHNHLHKPLLNMQMEAYSWIFGM